MRREGARKIASPAARASGGSRRAVSSRCDARRALTGHRIPHATQSPGPQLEHKLERHPRDAGARLAGRLPRQESRDTMAHALEASPKRSAALDQLPAGRTGVAPAGQPRRRSAQPAQGGRRFVLDHEAAAIAHLLRPEAAVLARRTS